MEVKVYKKKFLNIPCDECNKTVETYKGAWIILPMPMVALRQELLLCNDCIRKLIKKMEDINENINRKRNDK